MEFLRFGSSIPGGYWGCCACCIIQNFKFDPDEKASIQLVSGDGGGGLMHGGEAAYAGPTYRDIFETRIRIGTFSTREMPNHAFFAILTESQIAGGHGKKWLEILKKNGFEFVRTVDNSVYSGAAIISKPGEGSSAHKNYIFGLFRNIGTGAVSDPFTPPAAWTKLAQVTPEAWEMIDKSARKDLTIGQQESQLAVWNAGKTSIKKESEIVAAGAPVTLSGQRLPGAAPKVKPANKKAAASPFAPAKAAKA